MRTFSNERRGDESNSILQHCTVHRCVIIILGRWVIGYWSWDYYSLTLSSLTTPLPSLAHSQSLIPTSSTSFTSKPHPSSHPYIPSLFEQVTDPRFHALPRTAQRVATLQDSISDLVYDVLIAKVRQSLAGVSTKSVWTAEEEDNAFDLPSFSAYPETYITVIGEYLLQLPQQLEPLVMAEPVGVGVGA